MAEANRGDKMMKYRLLRWLGPMAARAPWLAYRLAGPAGSFAWMARRGVRDRLIRNLLPFAGGDPERARRASRRACQNVARYWVDMMTLARRDLREFERRHLTIENEGLAWPLAEPGPVVIVSGHVGNPEMGAMAVTSRRREYVALVEPLEPPEFGALMAKVRARTGGHYHETGPAGLRVCLETLRAGGVVALVADRDIQGNGVCTPFAGRLALMPRGPWDLARRTGATVLPVLTRRTGSDSFRVVVYPSFQVASTEDREADVREAATRWAAVLESHIRQDPGQWTVFEDFWEAHGCGES
ncbi:MAG: lysophospholipid acyltransferase family protein [Chloroflexi bacterium]|nr:lysophospholipid acyltransferase family protein [Chloroflexota bacterium]